MTPKKLGIAPLMRNRSFQIAVVLWLLVSISAMMLTHRGIPLNIPALNRMNPVFAVAFSSIAIVVLIAEMGIVLFLTRGRPFPQLDLRALTSPVTGYLLGAASYPVLHLFESWTRYADVSNSAVSVLFVFLTFFPPGLMKSFLTIRTGNAWVHLWAFHAISPHVTVDTRLIVQDFDMR